MSFPRYPKTKPSGVEWLGDVPEHWEINRLKNLFSLMKRLPAEDDGIITAFRDGEVTLRSNRRTDGFTNAIQEHGYQRVHEFDLVIHAMDAFAGAIGVSDSFGKSTPVYSVCTPKAEWVNVYYYGRLLRYMALSGYINSLSKGIRERSTEFRWNEAANVMVTLPPLSEQTAIASFLDHETGKIDVLVEEQRRLIALLKEKRQAVISHAVTKGLNPHAPMAPSGVEWLGDVPEHWTVCFLKHHVATTNGFGFSSADFREEGVPLIRAGNIKNKSITQPTIFLPEDVVQKYQRVLLAAGDIVISMVGSDPEVLESAVGQVGIVPDSLTGAVPNQNVVILREDQTALLSRYLFYTVCSSAYRNHVNVFSHNLANQSIISSSLLVSAKFTFPDREEQEQIIAYLDTETAKLDTLTAEANRAIELLQERRTALISAAVTGKIDVRGFHHG